MKVMIAYDGTEHSELTLADLTRAGVPSDVEVLVVTIADVWVPGVSFEETIASFPATVPAEVEGLRARAYEAYHHAEVMSREGAEKLRELLPSATVTSRAYSDAPAWGLLEVAAKFQPDLISIGSHGRSVLKRLVIGSVSRTVLSQAKCSVRIVRDHTVVAGSGVRIVVGVDGSPHSQHAVQAVASRAWPAGSAVLAVAAIDPVHSRLASPLGSRTSPILSQGQDDRLESLTTSVDEAVTQLRAAGLFAEALVREGYAERVLLDTAADWGADSIVVGATGHGFVERVILGSVSAGLATHAHCPVEVVRQQ